MAHKKKDNILLKTLHGRLLSTDFFARNWLTILTIMVMFLIYITNRYQCLTRMERIQELQRQLEIVQTEQIYQKSVYMSSIRESAMTERIDSLHLGLSVQQQPPYHITY
ncbi:MAG: hypothetical protein K2L93_06150 [Muribaculaceae bacterium]|nr:hypothetical protein [Muribaculaceae bacterium]MDE6321866.1 hypothetical protein [Muribaculaceae bacterium]